MEPDKSFSLVIPAAGSGTRMGLGQNKLFCLLGDKPVLWHTLRAFKGNPWLREIVLVVREDELLQMKTLVDAWEELPCPIEWAIGGKTRQESVLSGVRVAKRGHYIWVHDGARPFISEGIQSRILGALSNQSSAVAAVPVKDTVKRVDLSGTVIETLIREELWNIQTPQVFQREALLSAYEKAERENFQGTDDASVMEYCGHPVHIVLGDYGNLKLTTPEDLVWGSMFLSKSKE